MSQPGRHRTLDDAKRNTICALVATGVSVRRAARFVECDPRTIRNEAQRNDEFRMELERCRSQAQIHPLRTLQQAARENWRAAAWWLQRLDPESFGKRNGLGKREANKFVGDLIAIIDRVVASPIERRQMEELLTAAMPGLMRRAWEYHQTRRRLKEGMEALERRRFAAADGPLEEFLAPEGRAAASVDDLLRMLREEFHPSSKRPVAERATAATEEKLPLQGVLSSPVGNNAAPPAAPPRPNSHPPNLLQRSRNEMGA